MNLVARAAIVRVDHDYFCAFPTAFVQVIAVRESDHMLPKAFPAIVANELLLRGNRQPSLFRHPF
jgi:hypothetical protein